MTDTNINPAQQALIDKMKAIEARDYKSADAFARALGIDPGHLCKVKSGKSPAGIKILNALWAKHPEAADQIKNYLFGSKQSQEAVK